MVCKTTPSTQNKVIKNYFSNFKKKVFDGPCTAQKNQKMHILLCM